MATKAVNAKSQTVAARVPHDVMNAVEAVKTLGESTGQFVTAALKREVEFRRCQQVKEKK
ncbi:YlcI/YnfO family protein [Pectobacterium carotovorum]|uniref:YlcI/YnfO family protein n=1 Tax=Pectobacterium carotovorum TaxID=554 RepID=UPI00301A9D96